MNRFLQNLNKIPKAVLTRNIAFASVVLLSLQILSVSSYKGIIDQKVFHPFVFWLRHQLIEPELDPRVKIFAFDDRTAAALESLDISLETWSQVLLKLTEKENVRVIVDKLFDVPYSDEEVAKFKESLNVVGKRISIISFAHPEKISFRKEVPDALLESNTDEFVNVTGNEWLDRIGHQNSFVYSAKVGLLAAFGRFGHANYEGDNRSKPVILLENGSLLPNAALTVADKVEIGNNGLMVNGYRVPTNRHGKILLNFQPKSFYLKKAFSFLPVVERAKAKRDISIVNPGDIVILLPAMYTGNTDFRETPFGPMAGGYHLVALVQSMLSGKWLAEWSDPGVLVILFGLVGFVLGFLLSVRKSLAAAPILILLTIATSCGLFLVFDVAWSFTLPLMGLLVTLVFGITLRSRVVQIEEIRIQRELEVATLVQKTFFPKTNAIDISVKDRVTVHGSFAPASECGGDWWGSFRCNGYTYVMIGDAIGHGVPAALVTAVSFSVAKTVNLELSQSTDGTCTPSHLMSNISKVLVAMNSQLACMTFLAFRIHEETGETLYANAGNQQPFLIPKSADDPRLAKGQRCKALMARGNVLGVESEHMSSDHTITLISGDRVALFTDGLIENTSQQTGKQIGRSWLKAKLTEMCHLSSSELCEGLWKSYITAIGSVPPNDDTTIVVFELNDCNPVVPVS